MELTDRQKRVLRAVVEIYIETAEPVGSKSILERSDLNVSSATIRNELAELTAQGLLEQPHTSAGRIPAPKGYRLYVNALMEEHRLSVQETERLNEALHLKMRELDRVMDEAGRAISQLTRYPAFALSSGTPFSSASFCSIADMPPSSESSYVKSGAFWVSSSPSSPTKAQ